MEIYLQIKSLSILGTPRRAAAVEYRIPITDRRLSNIEPETWNVEPDTKYLPQERVDGCKIASGKL
jgi:hypothetical protein